MFKKEINLISDLNLNKIQILGNRFSIEQIKKSKIHPAIFQYINSAIDLEIFNDRKKIENDSVFNYNGDRINNYFGLISEEIKRTQNFDFSYIKLILQNAIIFNTNYLTRPNKTLTNFVFGEYEIKSIEEIIIRISHAHYYRYLQKILLTYLDKKKILSMKRDEFVSLLNRIDLVSKETHLDDTIATAISSMANYFDQSSKISEKLPLSAICFYLEEKGLFEFKSKLEKHFSDDLAAVYSATDITNIINSVTPETEMIIDDLEPKEDELLTPDIESENVNSTEDTDKISMEIEGNSSELFEEHNNGLSNSDVIFEAADDDIEIPNNEILSNNELTDQMEQKDINYIESMALKVNSELAEIDIKDSQNETTPDNFDNEKIDEDEPDKIKKKPSTKTVLREFINLDSLYNSLLPSLKPFENGQYKFDYSEISENLSEELNFKIDVTTLEEEIELKDNLNKNSDHLPYLPKYFSEKGSLDEENNDSSNFDNKESIGEFAHPTNVEDNNFLDFNETIENVVNDENNETQFLSNKEEDILNFTNDQKHEPADLIDDTKLRLTEEDDEELTEVFTDLTYLDKEDEIDNLDSDVISENMELNDNISEKDNTDENFENGSNDVPDDYATFADLISSKDVTKIIEIIFDYDMEDYHSLINKISESSSEGEAFKITDDYCQQNHIEIFSNEVETFKSLISEYFTQAFS